MDAAWRRSATASVHGKPGERAGIAAAAARRPDGCRAGAPALLPDRRRAADRAVAAGQPVKEADLGALESLPFRLVDLNVRTARDIMWLQTFLHLLPARSPATRGRPTFSRGASARERFRSRIEMQASACADTAAGVLEEVDTCSTALAGSSYERDVGRRECFPVVWGETDVVEAGRRLPMRLCEQAEGLPGRFSRCSTRARNRCRSGRCAPSMTVRSVASAS